MDKDQRVRILAFDDAAGLLALRREALERHPLSFSATAEDDLATSLEAARATIGPRQHAVILGLFAGATLVGMLGVHRAAKLKRRHQCSLWGMFVTPTARRAGGGRALLAAAVAWAEALPDVAQLHLAVAETALEARRLYETAGFRAWGREPRALRWQGSFADYIHMGLMLEPAAGPSP